MTALAHADLAGNGALAMIRRIEDGLPAGMLESLAAVLAPGDAAFKYRIVPKATWARRKGGRLTPAEGAVVARLARLWDDALDLWQDPGDARHFLTRPHMMLEDQRPLDLAITSEFGADAVREILARLRYAIPA
ncbi:MAG: DUF2384 domain-containing protein [Paracoccaceae bacterium]|nr:MAG: DUF2384 domain-containing protein [Paracoccaceae bacterium]